MSRPNLTVKVPWRACAADTHIPAPLSSLTPIDPRTLNITRGGEFWPQKLTPKRGRSICDIGAWLDHYYTGMKGRRPIFGPWSYFLKC